MGEMRWGMGDAPSSENIPKIRQHTTAQAARTDAYTLLARSHARPACSAFWPGGSLPLWFCGSLSLSGCKSAAHLTARRGAAMLDCRLQTADKGRGQEEAAAAGGVGGGSPPPPNAGW